MSITEKTAGGQEPRPFRVHQASTLFELQGQELFVTDWTCVSQEMITLFARATKDFQWIHVDVERAKQDSPFGNTVAHGFLTLSLIAKFYNENFDPAFALMGLNYGLNRVRFITPVMAGGRIRGRFRLDEVQAIEGGIQLSWLVTVELEGQDRPACVAEFINREYFIED